MAAVIETTRKVVLTVYDFIKVRLATDAWDDVTVVDYNKGWPDDKRIILPSKTDAIVDLDPYVVIPALAIKKQTNAPFAGVQVGGGVHEDVMLFLIEYYALTGGQQISLEGYLQRILSDVVMHLKDWAQYPQTSPAPSNLGRVDLFGIQATPLEDPENGNPALRCGGFVSFGVKYYRSESVITN